MDNGKLSGGRFSKWFGVAFGLFVMSFATVDAIETMDNPIAAVMTLVFLGLPLSVAAGYFGYLLGRGPEVLVEKIRQTRLETRERQEEIRERMEARRSQSEESGSTP
jgi:hypothetical protein